MAQLRQDHKLFKDQNTEVIVIGPEDTNPFKEFWIKERMPFPGISDPQHIIAKKYGQEVKMLKLGRMPALLIIDREGLIRFRHHGTSMSDIPQNDDVIRLLEELNNEFDKR
jgi:peroxiredoxin